MRIRWLGLWRWEVQLGRQRVAGWALTKDKALMRAAGAHALWESRAD